MYFVQCTWYVLENHWWFLSVLKYTCIKNPKVDPNCAIKCCLFISNDFETINFT